MPRVPVAVAGGSAISQSPSVNNQYSLNWYPVSGEQGAKSQLSMFPTPGLTSLPFDQAGVGPIRTIHGIEFRGSLYFISRGELLKISPDFLTVTSVGTLNTESGMCDMAASPTELVIVDGTDGYIWNDGYNQFTTVWTTATAYSLGDKRQSSTPDGTLYFEVTTAGTSGGTEPTWPATVGGTVVDGSVTWTARDGFSQITDPDFPAADTITWLNFRFIANVAGTGQFQWSALNDASDWDGLDFATAEAVADDVVRVWATTDTLYVIGRLTTEIYYDSGNSDLPYIRRANGVVNVGTEAPWSLAEGESGELIFLSYTPRGKNEVVRLRGGQYSLLSDKELSARIDTYGDTSDATAWVYTQAGHTFYVLNLTATAGTICYDLREGFWHDRQTYGTDRHRAGGYAYFNGKHVVCCTTSAHFWEYDLDARTDGGTLIQRIRRGMFIYKDSLPITIHKFGLHFQAGVGLESGQSLDPMAVLRYSRDGRTWSNDMPRPIGKIGEYKTKTVWDALGTGEMFMYEITVSDPVYHVLVGGYADIEVGYV